MITKANALLFVLCIILMIIFGVVFQKRLKNNKLNSSSKENNPLPDGNTKISSVRELTFAEQFESFTDKLSQFSILQSTASDLKDLYEDFSRPLTIVIMGQFKSGKSSFINALLKQDILTVDVTPATAAVTVVKYGEKTVVRAIYDDKVIEYSIDELHQISAESDEHGVELRQGLRYLEIELPNEVLKKFTIVDTPGLNSTNSLHTLATEHFMKRSDIIFWIFAYGNTGTATEITEIRSLGEYLKPVAIINRIDEHDAEEGPLEDTVDAIKRRLQGIVSEVISVSAKWARLGEINQDDQMLLKSNWAEVEELITHYNEIECKKRKLERFFGRFIDIISNSLKLLEEPEAEYSQAYKFIHQETDFLKELKQQRSTLVNQQKIWSQSSNQTLTYVATKEIPRILISYQQLEKVHQTLIGSNEQSEDDRKKLSIREEVISERRREYNKIYTEYQERYHRWEHSGIFGGKPLKGLFGLDAEGDMLQGVGTTLNEEKNSINSEEHDISERLLNWKNQLNRLNEDAERFRLEVEEALKSTLLNIYQKLGNIYDTRRKYQKTLDELSWVPRATAVVRDEIMALKPGLSKLVKEQQAKLNDLTLDIFEASQEIKPEWLKEFLKEVFPLSSSRSIVAVTSEQNYDNFDYLLQAAKSGDAEAQADLGEKYYKGYDTDINVSEALKWFRKAEEKGNLKALYYLSDMYYDGVGIEKNIKISFDLKKRAAEGGFPDAQFEIGFVYAIGNEKFGVLQDEVEGLKWLCKASDQGNANAQFFLGARYELRVDDSSKAYEYYLKAAQNGSAEAQVRIGSAYNQGEFNLKDKSEAVKWFKKAMENKDIEDEEHYFAQYGIGMYFIENNLEKGLNWIKKSAEHGFPQAMLFLGKVYSMELYGVKIDSNNAIYWLTKTAEEAGKEGAEAQLGLGTIYYEGTIVPKDEEKALEWFRKSAEQGNANAEGSLGYLYGHSEVVGINHVEAYKWLSSAAKKGCAPAQCNLGWAYYKGEGIEKDEFEAFIWFNKAAEQGERNAQEVVGYMYENGIAVGKNKTKAADWYRKAIAQGSTEAKERLQNLMDHLWDDV